jgi:hypothetical protein
MCSLSWMRWLERECRLALLDRDAAQIVVV